MSEFSRAIAALKSNVSDLEDRISNARSNVDSEFDDIESAYNDVESALDDLPEEDEDAETKLSPEEVAELEEVVNAMDRTRAALETFVKKQQAKLA